MRPADVRNWLGMYVLLLTAVVGAWLLMAPQALLPLEDAQRTAASEIIIPFLLGQLAAVFRYFSNKPGTKLRSIDVPTWAIKAPPIIVTLILLVEFVMLGVGGVTANRGLTPSPPAVCAVITFCVAVLNTSTVYVMAAYFESQGRAEAPARGLPSTET